MGAVGQWDEGLFRALREASARSEREPLEEQLARTHAPLVRKITAELTGRARGRVLFGAHKLPWDDALGAANIGFVKALRDFDPTRGTFPSWVRRKIYVELQGLLEAESAIRINRDRHGRSQHDGDDVVVCFDEERDTPEPETREDLPPALERALERFIGAHCLFAPSARVAMTMVRGRFELVLHESCAADVGIDRALHALRRTFDRRGVRRTTVRVPWAADPVYGLRGVSLQSTGSSRPPTSGADVAAAAVRKACFLGVSGPPYVSRHGGPR